jgi:large repetitive protein
MVALAGSVTDDNPATAVVIITSPNQDTVVASVNADGSFYATDSLASLGEFSAQAVDEESLYSAIAACSLSVTTPTVSLTGVVEGGNHDVTVTGQVAADLPAGLIVNLSGVVQGQAVVNGDGTFSFTGTPTAPGSISASVVDVWGQSSNTADIVFAVAAPTVSIASITYAGGQSVTVTGQVNGDLSGLGVTLSGVVQGQATVSSDGTFSYTGIATATGTVSASAVDDWGQTSNTADRAFTVDAPTTFITGVTQAGGQTVTVTGQVTGDLSSAMSVVLSGVVQGQAALNSDGTFSFTGSASEAGTMVVAATDVWGQTAAPASVTLTNDAPLIDEFAVVPVDGFTYEFRGHVSDEHAAGLIVTIAGLPSLGANGVQVVADENGNFAFQVAVSEEDCGTVTASTQDAWGASAQVATISFEVVAPAGPSLTITVTSITQGANRQVTVTGFVTGDNVNGLNIGLTGVLTGTTASDAAGNFTFTGVAADVGAVVITATDAENNTSDPVTAMLTNVAPTINDLHVEIVELGQTYEIQGTVTDEWSPGLTVWLTGLPILGMGREVTVSEDHTFKFRFNATRDETTGAILDVGTITASVTDWFGLTAEEATYRFLP